MKKLTQLQIEEIIYMKKVGVPTKDIIKEFGISKGTLYHHTSEVFREKMRAYHRKWYKGMPKEKKKANLDKRREYQNKYHRERYKNDKEFRIAQIERVKNGRVKALEISKRH